MSTVDGTRGRAANGRGSGSALEELLKREQAKPAAEPMRAMHRSGDSAGRQGRDDGPRKARRRDHGERR